MECRSVNDWVFVRIDPGERLIESLKTVATEWKIKVAAITSGVGMFSEATLGFYRPEEDRYDEHEFKGEYEICSLQGNITWRDEDPFVHVHGIFSDAESKAFGGHVIEATCCVTMEIFLRQIPIQVVRGTLPDVTGTRIVPRG